MFIISCIYVVLYFYIGFIVGFSKSPYSHKILTIINNIIMKITPIISIEIVRSIIITRNKNNTIIQVILIITLTLAEINYNNLLTIRANTNKEELFKYICSNIIPLISNNILYTYLCSYGSHWLVLIYRLYKELTILILPILPNMDWFATGSFNILSSIIIYLSFKYKFIRTTNNVKKRKQILLEKTYYTIVIIFLVILIFFMLGTFNYKPIVVASNSMEPLFSKGDVVIYKKIDVKELSKNDIIVYTLDNRNIIHRIVKKIEGKKFSLYKTKGDKNNTLDVTWVKEECIKGKYVFHVKYVGFPAIWLHQFLNEKVQDKIK